eukprot:1176413-Prorocentrum_minimum.AAC.2
MSMNKPPSGTTYADGEGCGRTSSAITPMGMKTIPMKANMNVSILGVMTGRHACQSKGCIKRKNPGHPVSKVAQRLPDVYADVNVVKK